MSLMNKQQREARNAEEFRAQLQIFDAAGVGVLLCRTREPYRAISVLRQFAFGAKQELFVWSNISGWARHNAAQAGKEVVPDSVKEPNMALAKIGTSVEPMDQTTFGPGVFVMYYPHYYLKNAVFVQQLKEYAHVFTQVKKRLVLVCVPGTTLPPELEDDISVLDFDPPSHFELATTYKDTFDALPDTKRPKLTDEDRELILSAGIGLTAHEAANALSRALVVNRQKLPNVSAAALAAEIMKVKVEAVKKTEILEVMPSVDMANVGGLENLKDWVALRRTAYSDEARAFGIEAPKGVVLAGPPGTGKSLVAKAIAHVMRLPLLKFDLSKVFGSLVGETEQKVRATLKLIEGMAPCIVLFDEVDKMLGGAQSGGGDSGVTKRVLGAILTWMQETQAPIFNVLTLNRVEQMPAELLRRGRLDEVFSVSVPNPDERLEILKIHLRKRGHEDDVEGLEQAVTDSEGYVPAELEAAVKDALIEAFNSDRKITGALIAKQLANMVPISQAFSEDFNAMQLWASQNARPANRDNTKPVEQQQQVSRVRTRPGRAVVDVSAGARQVDLDG